VKRTKSNRVAERLRRLRVRFGEGIREQQVDYDHESLTRARSEHVPLRTFYLGEIWWADRYAFGDHRASREGSSHLPALITERQPEPDEPVEGAPPFPRRLRVPEAEGMSKFEVSAREGAERSWLFALALRGPVPRSGFSGYLAALAGRDKQALAQAPHGREFNA